MELPSHYLGAASAAPNSAALSGSHLKAPALPGIFTRSCCRRSSTILISAHRQI